MRSNTLPCFSAPPTNKPGPGRSVLRTLMTLGEGAQMPQLVNNVCKCGLLVECVCVCVWECMDYTLCLKSIAHINAKRMHCVTHENADKTSHSGGAQRLNHVAPFICNLPVPGGRCLILSLLSKLIVL